MLNLIFTELFIFGWFKLEMQFQKTGKHSKPHFPTPDLTRDHNLIKRSQLVSLDKLVSQNKLILTFSSN